MAFHLQEERIRYRMDGQRLRQWRITPTGPDETMIGDDLRNEIQRIINANPGSDMRVAARIPGLGWRSSPSWFHHSHGEFSLVGDATAYDMVGDGDGHALDQIEEVILIARKHVQPAGGCRPGAPYKDCFWRALSSSLNGHLPPSLRSDKVLRSTVGAPPPGELFPGDPALLRLVEQALPADVALRVTGDVVYASAKKASRIVHLRLRAEHFELMSPEGRTHSHATAKERHHRPLRAIVIESDCAHVYGMDCEPTTVSRDEAIQWLQKPFSAPCVPLRGGPSAETAMAALKEWHIAREELLEPCHLDLFHYHRYKSFALELFRHLSQTIPASEKLDTVEEQWVASAIRGGLIWGRSWEGPAIQLDVRSMYGWVMSSKICLPWGASHFETLAQLPAHPSLGLYRCVITVPPRMTPLWRGASPRGSACGGIYTHIDLELTRLLGGTIELVCDGGANAALYPRDKAIPACQILGEFISKLYTAKRAGSTAAKRVMNILWGALAERRKRLIVVREDEEADICGEVVRWGRYAASGDLFFKVIPPGEPIFAGEYPQFASFITAKARLEMAKMLLPHIDRLRRIHTDGFVLDGDDLPADLAARVGDELGDLKVEHRGLVVVKNAMLVRWLAPGGS